MWYQWLLQSFWSLLWFHYASWSYPLPTYLRACALRCTVLCRYSFLYFVRTAAEFYFSPPLFCPPPPSPRVFSFLSAIHCPSVTSSFFAISVLRCHSTCTMSAAAAAWNNMRSTVAGNITVSTSRSARLRLVISYQLPFFLAFFFLDHNTTCIYVGLLNIEMCAKWRVPHDWSLQIR